jgi:hypothetical protein
VSPLSEGDGVLNDPLALTVEDDTAQGEQRSITIGMNVFGALMMPDQQQSRGLLQCHFVEVTVARFDLNSPHPRWAHLMALN